jgi:hypothetical protein
MYQKNYQIQKIRLKGVTGIFQTFFSISYWRVKDIDLILIGSSRLRFSSFYLPLVIQNLLSFLYKWKKQWKDGRQRMVHDLRKKYTMSSPQIRT